MLKGLVVNDNVNNVKLSSYDVIFYVTLFVAAIFISPVFRTHWRYWLKRQNSLRGCNKKVKSLRAYMAIQCQYDLEAHLGHIITCIYRATNRQDSFTFIQDNTINVPVYSKWLKLNLIHVILILNVCRCLLL